MASVLKRRISIHFCFSSVLFIALTYLTPKVTVTLICQAPLISSPWCNALLSKYLFCFTKTKTKKIECGCRCAEHLVSVREKNPLACVQSKVYVCCFQFWWRATEWRRLLKVDTEEPLRVQRQQSASETVFLPSAQCGRTGIWNPSEILDSWRNGRVG